MDYWSFILFSFLMLIGLFWVIFGIGAVGQMRAGDAFGGAFSMLAAPILLLGVILFIPASITGADRAAGLAHSVYLHAFVV